MHRSTHPTAYTQMEHPQTSAYLLLPLEHLKTMPGAERVNWSYLLVPVGGWSIYASDQLIRPATFPLFGSWAVL